MLLDFARPVNRLRALFLRPSDPPGPALLPLPSFSCPFALPRSSLPDWIANDPIVQKYYALLGDLPWAAFPERPADRPWPGPSPDPRAPFVAAFLVKLNEGKRFMSDLRAFLMAHEVLACVVD